MSVHIYKENVTMSYFGNNTSSNGAAQTAPAHTPVQSTAEVRDVPNSLIAPAPAVPSIASSAMLCELSISQWTGRKKDRRASDDVTRDNHADVGVASVNKKLLGNCAELVAVQKLTGNIRNIHYSMTMPWSDTGMRLVPPAQYFKYHQQMTALQSEWEGLVNQFLTSYDFEIAQAQVKLGDLFDRDEYPTVSALTDKFAFRLSYIPLPDAGDFRVDVGNDAMSQIKSHYEDYYSRQLTNAMNDIWQRTYKALKAMSERLDYTDPDTKKVFRNSLVDNVLDMIELLDVCNVTGDVQMTALKDKLDTALRGVTPDALREDDYLRAETKRAVDDVIAQLPSLDI